jgi:RNA polymerase sigma factor (sigma-70 family)
MKLAGFLGDIEAPSRNSRPAAHNKGGVEQFDDGYLERLRHGDSETAQHFDRYFRRLIRAKVWGKFSRQRAEDLVDDVMAVAIQNIMQQKLDDASRLPGYICGICANLSKVSMRPKSNREVLREDFERVADCAQTAVERLQEAEIAQAVGKVLSTLRRRDQEVLVDLFYNGLSREEAAEKYKVTCAQLRTILLRALKRFKKKWEGLSTVENQHAQRSESLLLRG